MGHSQWCFGFYYLLSVKVTEGGQNSQAGTEKPIPSVLTSLYIAPLPA